MRKHDELAVPLGMSFAAFNRAAKMMAALFTLFYNRVAGKEFKPPRSYPDKKRSEMSFRTGGRLKKNQRWYI